MADSQEQQPRHPPPIPMDYTRQPPAPSADAPRPLRIWIVLLLVWTVGLIVWIAYVSAAVYFFFRLFSANPVR